MLGRLMLSEFREAYMRTGKRFLVPASVVLLSFRPEGPGLCTTGPLGLKDHCAKPSPKQVARPK